MIWYSLTRTSTLCQFLYKTRVLLGQDAEGKVIRKTWRRSGRWRAPPLGFPRQRVPTWTRFGVKIDKSRLAKSAKFVTFWYGWAWLAQPLPMLKWCQQRETRRSLAPPRLTRRQCRLNAKGRRCFCTLRYEARKLSSLAKLIPFFRES